MDVEHSRCPAPESNLKPPYDVIYADPPWKYKMEKVAGSAADQYPCMSLEELGKLRNFIDYLAADDCALLLWITSPMLDVGLELLKLWGFKFTTVFLVWTKTYKHKTETPRCGMGFYTRISCEFLLLAKRGKTACWVQDHTVNQHFVHPAVRHSEKPDGVRQLIKQVFGADKKRVELFARAENLGSSDEWDYWGNEAGGTDAGGSHGLSGLPARSEARKHRQTGRPSNYPGGIDEALEGLVG